MRKLLGFDVKKVVLTLVILLFGLIIVFSLLNLKSSQEPFYDNMNSAALGGSGNQTSVAVSTGGSSSNVSPSQTNTTPDNSKSCSDMKNVMVGIKQLVNSLPEN